MKQYQSESRSNNIFQNLEEKLLSQPTTFLKLKSLSLPIIFSSMVANKNTLGSKWTI